MQSALSRCWLLVVGLAACAPLLRPTSSSPPDEAASALPPGVIDPAELELRRGRNSETQSPGRRELSFTEFSPAAFAQAQAQGKLLLLDCVATWCHWCHVMDETTYRDPQVQEFLQQHFVALRADIDARPDLAARYESYGWPATVILTPQGEELGKFRGYLRKDELLAALRSAQKSHAAGPGQPGPARGGLVEKPLPLSALSWLGPQLLLRIDDSYDEDEGGWGLRHKQALGAHIELSLRRAAHGDREALKRVQQTLRQQRGIYDPVWGGVYQYSVRGDWQHPHFEKLLPVQTSNLEALAQAFAQTHDRAYLDDALRIDGYLQRFLQDERGAFLVSQDADLGGFEGSGRFVDGHEYFRLDDAGRRALGIPRVDRSVYGQENGLGIAALTRLAQVLPDRAQAAAVLNRARRAADTLLAQRVDAAGAVWRGSDRAKSTRYLSDAAALGRGLALLAAATHEARYRTAAQKIGATLLSSFAVSARELEPGESRDLLQPLRASTRDPGAVGVFARRQQPFDANVIAARFLLLLGDPASTLRAQKILAALSSPSNLADRGFMLAEYLLALDEAGLVPWQPTRAH